MLITKAMLKQLCAVLAAGGVGAGGAAVAPKVVHAVKRPSIVRDLSRPAPAVAVVEAPICAQGLELAAVGDDVVLADAPQAAPGGGGIGGAPGSSGGGFAPIGGGFAPGFGGGFAPGVPGGGGVTPGGPGGPIVGTPEGSGPATPPTIAPTPVPEPGAWLTMIVGFGLVGFALRRPRVAKRSHPM
jgi:hypothetical protein